jgi:acyl carrier protein
VGTLEKIQTIVAGSLGIPRESVHAESKAEDLAGWDSLHHFMIMMEIEVAFGFKFSLQELAELDSVEKLLSAIQRRVSA